MAARQPCWWPILSRRLRYRAARGQRESARLRLPSFFWSVEEQPNSGKQNRELIRWIAEPALSEVEWVARCLFWAASPRIVCHRAAERSIHLLLSCSGFHIGRYE